MHRRRRRGDRAGLRPRPRDGRAPDHRAGGGVADRIRVSSRSSEVIHAGLYYAPDSLKARLCVQGRELCTLPGRAGLPHRRLGKLIVATEPALEPALTEPSAPGAGQRGRAPRAARCGAGAPTGACAALSRSHPFARSGIVDSHALMLSLSGDLQSHDGSIALGSPMQWAARHNGVWELTTGTDQGLSDQLRRAGQRRRPVGPACCGDDRRVSEGAHSIAAAGSRQLFFADAGGAVCAPDLPAARRRGWECTDAGPGRRGPVRPDVEWVDRIDFNVDARRAQLFYPSIRA